MPDTCIQMDMLTNVFNLLEIEWSNWVDGSGNDVVSVVDPEDNETDLVIFIFDSRTGLLIGWI